MNIEQIVKSLNLEEILKLLSIIVNERNFEELVVNNVLISENVTCSISKKGDSITVKTSDDRTLRVSLHEEGIEANDDYYNSYTTSKLVASIELIRKNGDITCVEGIVSNHGNYSDVLSLTPETLATLLKPKYIEYKDGKVTNFNWNGEPENTRITSNGIESMGFLVSPDCQKIVSIKGEKLPSYEALQSFDIETEKARVTKMLSENELSEVTKLAFENAMSYLERQSNYIRRCFNDYQSVLTNVKRLMLVRRELMKSFAFESFNYQELIIVFNYLKDVIEKCNAKDGSKKTF